MTNRKNREGSFYVSKVRLFLNEYGDVNLEEFCKAERVSSKKCAIVLVDLLIVRYRAAYIKNHVLNAMEYICDLFRQIKHTSAEDMENLLAHKWQPKNLAIVQL